MKTPQELVKKIELVKEGDLSTFTEVYEGSYKYLHTCVIHIVKNEDVAQDMLQDTYIEIFKNISQLKQPEDFLSWASTIANRKCYAYIKKDRDILVDERTDDEGNEIDFFESVSDDESFIPENIFDNKAKLDIIRRIIDDLSDVQRACVIGFYYNEQKQDEIAEQLGIPVNTVKSHLNRAKAKIKEAVGDVEKKQGIKLYSFAPFMLLLFGYEAKAYAATAPAMGSVLSDLVAAGAAKTVAGVAAAKTVTGAGAGSAAADAGTVAASASKVATAGAGTMAAGAGKMATVGAGTVAAGAGKVAAGAGKVAAGAIAKKAAIAAVIGLVAVGSITASVVIGKGKINDKNADEVTEESIDEDDDIRDSADERDGSDSASKSDTEAKSSKKETDIDPFIWKKNYLDYLKSYTDADTYEYDLIYLDDDDMPELYIDTQVMAGGTRLITFSKGKIREVDTGEYDGLSYIEKSGLMHISSGHGGGYEDRIVMLKRGRFSVLRSGSYSEMPDGNGGVDEEYWWEDEEVTREEYFAEIDKIYDKTKEKITKGQYTYDELCAMMAGEENTKAEEQSTGMSDEEMYQAASDLIGDKSALIDGTFFWSFSEYEGDPNGCFWSYGDESIPFSSIKEVSGDTVIAAGASIKVINPWTLEILEDGDSEATYVYSGKTSDIDEYMIKTGTPYVIDDTDRVEINYYMAFDNNVARLARNEIYARHGRKFKDPELQAFFNNREWYHGTIEPNDFSDNLLNEVERHNVQILMMSEY